jgi:hypothetical protein
MQKKLIYTTLIFVISIFFFGCTTYESSKAPGYNIFGIKPTYGFILLAGYSSLKGGPAPAKIFKMNPKSGEVVAQCKLPENIHHGDGLACAGNSILWNVDNTGTPTYPSFRCPLNP